MPSEFPLRSWVAQDCAVLARSVQLNDTDERLVGIREVADLFAVDISTIRRWERAGHLTSVRVGERGHRRFRQSEIEGLLEARQTSRAYARQRQAAV